MNFYESIMQGLTEAIDYQQGKILARKTKLKAWENGRNKPLPYRLPEHYTKYPMSHLFTSLSVPILRNPIP